MSAVQKQIVRDLLQRRDFEPLKSWVAANRRALATLYSLTFEADALIKWRAIEAVGIAARVKADQDLEKVRDFIRRCIWLMNDESGGLGWHSPEVIGEILVNVPELIPEYGGLLPHYFHEEPFEAGAVLALSRVGRFAPSLIEENADALLALAGAPKASIRYHAVKALQTIDTVLPEEVTEQLASDSASAPVYDFETGELWIVSVGDCLSTH